MVRAQFGWILKHTKSLSKAAGLVILVIAVYIFVLYFNVSIDVIQTFALLAVVVLSAITFWYRTLRGPKFKIYLSPIEPIKLCWNQQGAVGNLDIIISNEGAKVGTVSKIEVLEGNKVSENIQCHPRHLVTEPPPFSLPAALTLGEPIKLPLLLTSGKTQVRGEEIYRIRIRVKGSDTCETEEFEVTIPEGGPRAF